MRRLYDWRDVSATLAGEPLAFPQLGEHLALWRSRQSSRLLAVSGQAPGPVVPLCDPRQVCWEGWAGPASLKARPRPMPETIEPVILLLLESEADELLRRAAEAGLTPGELVARLLRVLAQNEEPERLAGE